MKINAYIVGVLLASSVIGIVWVTDPQTSLGDNSARKNKDILLSILQEVRAIRLDVQIIKDGLRSKEVNHSKFCPTHKEHPMDGHTYDYPDDPHGTNFPPKEPKTLLEATEEMDEWFDGPLIGNGG